MMIDVNINIAKYQLDADELEKTMDKIENKMKSINITRYELDANELEKAIQKMDTQMENIKGAKQHAKSYGLH